MKANRPQSSFTRFAKWTARVAGINTGTTIVTFLTVFLIQNTQNREAEARQLKLDELIRAIGNAQNALLDVAREGYQKLASAARIEERRRKRKVRAASAPRKQKQKNC